MSIGLENFRQVRGGFLEREIKLDKPGHGEAPEAVRQSGRPRLAARLGGWISSKLSGPQSQERVEQREQARVGVKREFLELLRRTEGSEAAKRALKACRLPDGWENNDRPLTNHQVGRILDAAQECRRDVVRHNDRMLSYTLARLPRIRRDLRAAISRAVKTNVHYGSQALSSLTLEALCKRAAEDLCAVRRQQCQERFPALSQYILNTPEDSDLKRCVDLNPATLIDDLRNVCDQDADFRRDPMVRRALEQIDRASGLLGRRAWNMGSLQTLSAEIEAQVEDLDAITTGLRCVRSNLSEVDPLSEPKQQLYAALRADIERHTHLLQTKCTYVDEMRLIDPLTNRAVAHSNLVWMHAGRSLLDRLEQMVLQDQVRLTDEQIQALSDIMDKWVGDCVTLSFEYRGGLGAPDPNALTSIPAPSKGNRATHPIVQGKRNLLRGLYNELDRAGIPWTTLNELFSKPSLKQAERAALTGIQTWQPVSRDMPVMRNGVVRTYRSEIVPSSARDSADHASNLTVSRLRDPSNRIMTTVVGHGVLDMWGIPDANQRRQANQRGAQEVLELALSTNARLRNGLTAPRQAENTPSPRLVHVSVNLVSPESVLGLFPSRKDRQEKTHALNQFEAFEANAGRDRTLRLLGGNHQDAHRTATVHVEPITFSFGVNGMGMGATQHFMLGGWGDVHAHNTRNMIKLVGDLGEGRFGARGATPGGFIGEVHDRLISLREDPKTKPADRDKAEALLGQLRGQTDLVRALFSEEAFRQGKGDTAKMGREILVLQSLAEQGLDLLRATDLAATMSKGSKHDLDRGEVMGVELKTKLILRDLGGDMRPDERLQGDDQGVYYVVSAGSGQLEHQRWNTGLPGSKAADLQAFRLPDPEVRQFLSGLNKFASSPA